MYYIIEWEVKNYSDSRITEGVEVFTSKAKRKDYIKVSGLQKDEYITRDMSGADLTEFMEFKNEWFKTHNSIKWVCLPIQFH